VTSLTVRLGGVERSSPVVIRTTDGKITPLPFVCAPPFAFSPDGKILVTGWSSDNGPVIRSARLWDVERVQPIGQPLEHPPGLLQVVFHPSSRSMATFDSAGTIRLWDTSTGRVQAWALKVPATRLAFTDGGRALAATTERSGLSRLLDVPLPFRVRTVAVGLGEFGFSPGGTYYVTTTEDPQPSNRRSRLWRVGDGRELGPKPPPMHIAFSPDDRIAILFRQDGPRWSYQFWDLVADRAIGTTKPAPTPSSEPAFLLAWRPGNRSVVMLTRAEQPAIPPVPPGARRGRPGIEEQLLPPRGVPGVEPVPPAGLPGRRRPRGVPVPPVDLGPARGDGGLPGRRRPRGVPGVEPVPRTAALWIIDVATGEASRSSIPVKPRDEVSLLGDGKTIAIWDPGASQTRLWDLDSGRPLSPPSSPQIALPDREAGRIDEPGGMARRETIRPDGRLALFHTPLEQATNTRHASFSPDGAVRLTVAADGSAQFWDVATALPLGPPLDFGADPGVLRFSPDGHTLSRSVSDSGTGTWKRRIELLDVPVPMPGDPEQIVLWSQVATGLELDPDSGVVRRLDPGLLSARQQQLQSTGSLQAP
jgi:WD40 repeat protein